jgi:hypothetical protein
MNQKIVLAVLTLSLLSGAVPLVPTALDSAEQKARRIAPIRRPPAFEEKRRAAEAMREAIESGRLMAAPEEEAAIKPTPRRPVVTAGFAGMDAGVNAPSASVPPDTIAAAGPNHIVEVVNSAIAIYDKATGAAAGGFPQLLSTFFTVNISDCIFDPVVAYDELLQRFYIGALDVPALCGEAPGSTARLLYAVSDSFDPTAGFSAQHAIDVDEPGIFGCPPSTTVWGDFPRTGWNADAHVFSLNMFPFVGNCFDHVSIIVIDKSTIDGVLTVRHHNFDDSHFTITPATMHGASPGDPMWLVEETNFGGGNQIRVIKMTDVLSATPTFTLTDVTVATYGFPPTATQKGGGRLDAGDARMLHSEWRGNRLVATHTVGRSGTARARWYEFDTTGLSPTLTQQGTISRGDGVHTYYPSIAIASNGDLGMTFMQSSSTQFVSMYITGRLPSDAPGKMQKPVLAKAGQANYRGFDCFAGIFVGPCRAGDYSGITVDPDTADTFCAANEYATSPDPDANWGTWITCFRIGVHDLAVTAITAPATATGTGSLDRAVKVTIQNRSDHKHKIPLADLGDGAATGLVRLSVDVIDTDIENCQPAGVQLNGTKNAAVFPNGSRTLKPRDKLTVHFLVAYECTAPVSNASSAMGDYSHTATVHHDDVDGNADIHAEDDVCPHPRPLGGRDPNPPPNGTADNGCGAKKPDGSRGDPVVTNVVSP